MEKRKETLSGFRACRFCLSQDGSVRNLHEKIQIPKNSVPFALKVLACIAVEVSKHSQFIMNLLIIVCIKIIVQKPEKNDFVV